MAFSELAEIKIEVKGYTTTNNNIRLTFGRQPETQPKTNAYVPTCLLDV